MSSFLSLSKSALKAERRFAVAAFSSTSPKESIEFSACKTLIVSVSASAGPVCGIRVAVETSLE